MRNKKWKFRNSLRWKLTVIYISIIMVPALMMVTIMPAYYQHQIATETAFLTKSTLSAINLNIETYLDDLMRLTMSPYFSEESIYALDLHSSGAYKTSTTYEKLVADRAIKGMLRNIFQNTRSDIAGTVLITFDKAVFEVSSTVQGGVIPGYPFEEQDWYQKAIDSNGKAAFISPHVQDYWTGDKSKQVFSVSRLIKNPYTQQPVGVIMADADTVALKRIFDNVSFNVSSIVAVFDENQQIIHSSGQITSNMIEQILTNQSQIEGEKDSYEVISSSIGDSNWHVYVLLSQSEMKSQARWIYAVGILLAFIGTIVTFSVFKMLSKRITDPFVEMIKVMQSTENGDLSVKCAVDTTDEIGKLGTALNSMIEKLDQHIQSEYRAVLNLRNAEYFALQSQIQPHFLYNTLNGFVALNRMGEQKLLEKGIMSLTGMMRYILGHRTHEQVEDEFKYLERYLELQKLRFDTRLCYEINMDDAIKAYLIPKLLLQPLIENAIIHGLEPLDQEVHLIICGEQLNTLKGDFLVFKVIDDGAGFDYSLFDMTQSVGLKNISERLKLAYSDSTFEIESVKGEGTKVIISIPMEVLDVESSYC